MPYTSQGIGYRPSETSFEAAEETQHEAPFWRLMVMQDLNLNGPSTADEIARRLNASVLTIRPRVSELRNTRKIYDTGERRKNVSGKSATVWAIIKGDTANV